MGKFGLRGIISGKLGFERFIRDVEAM